MMRVALLCLLCLATTSEAFDVELGPSDLTEAATLGRTGIESQRAQYHRPYRLIIGQPPLDYVDIITPFRRIVLEAEARLRAGERLFGQREALATLGERPEQVDLRLELTFHPLNTFVGVPAYDVELVSVRDGGVMVPQNVERVPRFGPRVNGLPTTSSTQAVGVVPGQTQPLLGGTIIAMFDGRVLDRTGSYEVRIREGDKVLARGKVDFAAAPFLQYWWVDDSTASHGWYEPQNQSFQYGLSLIWRF